MMKTASSRRYRPMRKRRRAPSPSLLTATRTSTFERSMGRQFPGMSVGKLNLTDLTKLHQKLVATMSKGMKQRLQLAVAILHKPEVLILDEPTSGVDPVARDQFWELLIYLAREKGVTIFICTHFMNEAQRCDRLLLMREGRIIADDAPQRILDTVGVPDIEEAFLALVEADGNGTKEGVA